MLPALLIAIPMAATLLGIGLSAEQGVDALKAQKTYKKELAEAEKAQEMLESVLAGSKRMADAGMWDQKVWERQTQDLPPSVAFAEVDFGSEILLLTSHEESLIREKLEKGDEKFLLKLLYRIRRDQPRRARIVNMGVPA